MFRMWNIRDVGCSGCGMCDVECLPGCGMLIYKMPYICKYEAIRSLMMADL